MRPVDDMPGWAYVAVFASHDAALARAAELIDTGDATASTTRELPSGRTKLFVRLPKETTDDE